MWLVGDSARLSCLLTVGLLVVVSCTEAVITKRMISNEESLMCSGTGMLVFEGDGRFSVVLENSDAALEGNMPPGSLMCEGEVSVMANSTFYTRIISKGRFECNSTSSVRICGYGDTNLIRAGGSSSLLQCNGEPLLPAIPTGNSTFNSTNMSCLGNGTFSVIGFGNFTLVADTIVCTGNAIMGMPTSYSTEGDFVCSGNGPYTISGYGRLYSVSGNCTNGSFPMMKYCTGSGGYSICGDGNYSISTQSGNISCFGDVNSHGLYITTFSLFCCQGQDTYTIGGSGLIYTAVLTDYDSNCSSLLDNTNTCAVSYDSNIFTSCVGTGANVFCGNGYFYIAIHAMSTNNGLECVGSVDDTHMYNGTLYSYSYGPFRCVASGDLSINGTGVMEGDDILCSAIPIIGEPLQCSGTGEFTIVGSGFFDIVAIPEITCIGTGEHSIFDLGERFVSRGSFTCNGSEYFTLNGTGVIESVTTDTGTHNCTDMIPIGSGSGVIDVLTCSGEGNYVIVGDGEFYINRTGPGMLDCSGEVISGINASHRAEYFTNGEFNCMVSGITYFAGTGRAEVINASASYECNGIFFPGPTLEPPFSGFGGEEISCIAYGEYIIVGSGQLQVFANSSTPLECQGSISTDLDHNIATSNGDFICTGKDIVAIFGRGEVFVNSTGFNNCAHRHTMISNNPLFCSGFGEYEIFGSANATIYASDELACNGQVFPLSSYEQHLVYYVGGNYRCSVNGLFNITGLGNAMIVSTTNDTGASNYSCFDFRSLTCATFALNSSTDEYGYDSNIFTSCAGYGTYEFCGNGHFNIAVHAASSYDDLRCVGSVNGAHMSNGTLYTYSYGQFNCMASGNLSINGNGVIEDDDVLCSANLTGEPLQCSGTGEFTIIGSGVFDIVAIPEIACTGTGEHSIFDLGERFVSRGSFACSGSEYFTLNGTGVIESVTTDTGAHNCTDMIPIGSGSGVIDVLTCSGEGNYVIVGDGEFYINRTGPGMLHCSGEVISGINASHRAEYFTNGEFNCMVSGITYFAGTGRAEVINASASYECNGIFFPGPTSEPPFSGFGGEEISCVAYGEYVIVGGGQLQVIAQSSTPLDCQGSISTDLDHNITTSNGDFICSGKDFVTIVGRGEVFVNSTGFNNCTRYHTMISNNPLICSGFGEYEIFGSANATIFASDELTCDGEVFPLTSYEQGSVYYVGGNYRCTVNGLFNITGVGDAVIVSTTNDTGANNYSCFGFQSLTCAAFAFNNSTDENVVLMGDGEFTIIGDKELYCSGNAVLCPGEINYYFTDGYFYCSSDVFAYINGTGNIENVSGVNNCSGFGFGVTPIISGAPLTPQTSCIGFGDEYQIRGNGTFNTSRLLGELNCNVTFQEPKSDLLKFSSYKESFTCAGNGIFIFEGTGDSAIILDKGYFDCVDLATSITITSASTMMASTFITINPTPTVELSTSTTELTLTISSSRSAAPSISSTSTVALTTSTTELTSTMSSSRSAAPSISSTPTVALSTSTTELTSTVTPSRSPTPSKLFK